MFDDDFEVKVADVTTGNAGAESLIPWVVAVKAEPNAKRHTPFYILFIFNLYNII